jgi:hypothetical protein
LVCYLLGISPPNGIEGRFPIRKLKINKKDLVTKKSLVEEKIEDEISSI